MLITVKYFGQIAEVTQTEEEQLHIVEGSILELLQILNLKYSKLIRMDFKIAQNKELVSLETPLTGAEIALMPPFSGG